MTDDPKPSRSKQIEELVFIKMPHVAGGLLFLIAAALNIVNVIARYVFSNPIFWAEEILIFIVIWGVFLVAGSITYRGGHLNMDLIYATLRPRWKRAVNIAIALTLIVCTVYTAMQSWKVVMLHHRNHSVTAVPTSRWCSCIWRCCSDSASWRWPRSYDFVPTSPDNLNKGQQPRIG